MRLATRPSTLLAALVLCAVLLAACGESSGGGTGTSTPEPAAPSSEPESAGAVDECAKGLKATEIPCGRAKAIAAGWKAAPGCAISGGASHATCRIEGFLCIAAAVEKGTVVSCALPGRSVLFQVRG